MRLHSKTLSELFNSQINPITLCLCIVGLASCVSCAPESLDEPNSNKKIGWRVPDQPKISSEIDDVLGGVNDKPIFPIPKSEDSQILLESLARYNLVDESKLSAAQFRELQETRAELARMAMEFNKVEIPHHILLMGVASGVDSLLKLHVFDSQSSRKKLFEFTEQFVNHENDNIAVTANFGRLSSELPAAMSGSSNERNSFLDQTRELINKFPDNLLLADELESSVVMLFQSEKRELGKQLMSVMIEEWTDSSNREMLNLVAVVKERLFLAELDFDLAVRDLQENRIGAADRFINVFQQVLENRQFSFSTYSEIQNSLRALEMFHEYELAQKAYDLLGQNAARFRNPNVVQAASFDVAMANRRLKLLGSKLTIDNGLNLNRDSFDLERFADSVRIVVFWSSHIPESVATVKELFTLQPDFASKGFDVIALNVDRNPVGLDSNFILRVQRESIVTNAEVGLTGTGNRFASDYGIQELPYLILLDRDGVVRELNLNMLQLKSQVSKYLED